MKDEKVCVICGTHYSYCPNCVDYKDDPRWKFLFHDKNCHDIFTVLNDFGAQDITKEQAANRLKKLDLSNKKSFRKDFADQIDSIMKPTVKPVKIKVTPQPKIVNHDLDGTH